jgi:hypothetical protein
MLAPRISRFFWRCFVGTALPAALAGCAPKEAADPHAMLGQDADEAAAEMGPPGPSGNAAAPDPGPPPVLATRAQCEAAVRRIQELGLDLAVSGAPEDEREELEARRQKELASVAFKQRVDEGTRECLQRETSARDAKCVAAAKSEMDVDRCGGGH